MPIEIEDIEPRRMPVVVLADTSGSMTSDGKIDVLNDAIRRMVDAFRQIDLPDCELALSVVSFGGEEAHLHLPMTPVAQIEWEPLTAAGRTPMGKAFDRARSLLEDADVVPPRSYRPNLVLVSDGIPTDDWKAPLKILDETEQARRALRFAVGIGADMKVDVLRAFAGDVGEVVPVEDVEMLIEFFKFVTYAVTATIKQPVQSQAELPTFKEFPTNDLIEF